MKPKKAKKPAKKSSKKYDVGELHGPVICRKCDAKIFGYTVKQLLAEDSEVGTLCDKCRGPITIPEPPTPLGGAD